MKSIPGSIASEDARKQGKTSTRLLHINGTTSSSFGIIGVKDVVMYITKGTQSARPCTSTLVTDQVQ
jgi:hypothetical protein